MRIAGFDGIRGFGAVMVVAAHLGMLEFLKAHGLERLFPLLDGKTCLEVGEGFLLVYRRNWLVPPQDINEFLATGRQVYGVLTNREPKDKSAATG